MLAVFLGTKHLGAGAVGGPQLPARRCLPADELARRHSALVRVAPGRAATSRTTARTREPPSRRRCSTTRAWRTSRSSIGGHPRRLRAGAPRRRAGVLDGSQRRPGAAVAVGRSMAVSRTSRFQASLIRPWCIGGSTRRPDRRRRRSTSSRPTTLGDLDRHGDWLDIFDVVRLAQHLSWPGLGTRGAGR